MLTYFPLRVLDDSGALVAGATLTTSALLNLATGAAITGVTITYVELGGGDYSLAYDADAHPEALLQVGASKTGSTITGANALIPVTLARTILAATGMDALLTDITSDTNMRASGFNMLRGLFNWAINKVTCTATTQSVNNDAGNVIFTMVLSDDNTTATKARSA